MKTSDMSESELIKAAHNMEQYGGGFAGHIARAFFAADGNNRRLLIGAFGFLFERYAPGQGWGHE